IADDAPEKRVNMSSPEYYDRYGQSSTIVVSQFPVDKWHGLMENPTTADAILDRLVHNSHRVVLQGESLRKNPPVVESSEKTR
ncbi:ATP-binding protein, partial [Escherichia coli]|uniref:ATP-binding protein n=1 Tax=Escherichia coli TaxID=562 RepID=UPI0003EF412B